MTYATSRELVEQLLSEELQGISPAPPKKRTATAKSAPDKTATKKVTSKASSSAPSEKPSASKKVSKKSADPSVAPETKPKTDPPKQEEPKAPETAQEVIDSLEGMDIPTQRSFKGRGSLKHRALQGFIKRLANGITLRATPEKGLSNNGGFVDVLLEGENLSIAVELALGSPLEQEVKNIRKSLDEGIDRVLVVSDSRDHLDEIKEAAQKAKIPRCSENTTQFLHTDDLPSYFNGLGATLAKKTTSFRGFKVSTSYQSLSNEERQSRHDAIHRIIAEQKQEEDLNE